MNSRCCTGPKAKRRGAPRRELNIGFIAYSPLGRGLLTGVVDDPQTMAETDARRRHPRFAAENIANNLALVERLKAIAARKNCTPGQLVLAWLLAQGEDFVPIPGTKRTPRLTENIGALLVRLSAADLAEIDQAVPAGAVAGLRYPEAQMKSVYV